MKPDKEINVLEETEILNAGIGRLARLRQTGQFTDEDRRLLDEVIQELRTVAKQIEAASKSTERELLFWGAVRRVAWWLILGSLDWSGGCDFEW